MYFFYYYFLPYPFIAKLQISGCLVCKFAILLAVKVIINNKNKTTNASEFICISFVFKVSKEALKKVVTLLIIFPSGSKLKIPIIQLIHVNTANVKGLRHTGSGLYTAPSCCSSCLTQLLTMTSAICVPLPNELFSIFLFWL